MRPFLLFTTILGFCVGSASALDYKTHVMPIFQAKCFKCHTDENGKDAKGGLALNNLPDMEETYVGKYTTMRPGDPENSLLLDHVSDPNSDDAMPPRGKGERMTAEEIELVRKWIQEGAHIFPPKPISSIPLAERPLMDWTSSAGTKVKARFKGLSGSTVDLVLENGKSLRVPLIKLSEESREQAKKLGSS